MAEFKVLFNEFQTELEQNEAFKYISLIGNAEYILNDQKALAIIKHLFLNLETCTSIYTVETSLKYSFIDSLINLISILKDVLISSINSNALINRNTQTLFMALIIIRTYTQISRLFCYEFTKKKGIHVLFSYLNDDLLLNEYMKISCEPAEKEYVFVNGIIRSIIQTLINLQNVYNQETKEFWSDCVPVLIKFLKTKYISDNKIGLYLAISNICDSDLGILLDEIIHENATLISYCAEVISKNEFVERISVNLGEDDQKQEGCIITSAESEWNLLNLLNALFNLSKINDRIKERIYYDSDLKSSLKSMIKNGNLYEKKHSLRLLTELISNKNILDNVKLDQELWMALSDPNESTVNTETVLEVIDDSSNDEISNDKKQIMISFNRKNRETCLLIKSELKKDYSVWIESENLSDSFKKAIQNSFCVIICLTEDYKNDARCRAQAEFAYQLSKPIIFVLLENALSSKSIEDDW
jgi:hypothetical protein